MKSCEPQNFLPQKRCFVRGFRQFSAHLTKCQACHGICTLSPLEAALTMRFAKNTQHDSSKVLRLPRKMKTVTSKVLCPPRKLELSSENVATVLRLPLKTTSTRYETFLNVTKCHACHAKRGYATCENFQE